MGITNAPTRLQFGNKAASIASAITKNGSRESVGHLHSVTVIEVLLTTLVRALGHTYFPASPRKQTSNGITKLGHAL